MEAFLRSFKTDAARRNLVLLLNAGGIAFGFLYYGPQFEVTAPWLWPLVPDSPFAVLVATVALGLWAVDRVHPVVDALAFVYMAKVGLWTAFVLALHPAHFGFSYVGTSMNTLLFYLHLGMAAEALAFLVDLEPIGKAWIAVLGWFLANDWVDYAWQAASLPGRDCPGLFPYTVPCDRIGLVAGVTVGLSVGLVASAWAWVRSR